MLAIVLTQSTPQAVSSPGHTHDPPEQIPSGGHGTLHAPQCWMLVVPSTQSPLQSSNPVLQRQEPPVHTRPPAHGCPQAPQ
jgi:hypothetical protein